MDDLIKLVRTYRLSSGLAERLTLADQIFRLIEPDLAAFVFSRIADDAAQDVLQEALKSIATGMKDFKGDTAKEFWKWCYTITRNKLADHFRRKGADRLQTNSPEELWEIMALSAQESPISPALRLDLEYVISILTSAKPECGDFLWEHFVFGQAYGDLAEAYGMTSDGVRMKIGRCLDAAKTLVN